MAKKVVTQVELKKKLETFTIQLNSFTHELVVIIHTFPTKGGVMESLFAAFKDSIESMNADKRYFLDKLSEMNKISDALGDLLGVLNDVASELEEEIEKALKEEQKKQDSINQLKNIYKKLKIFEASAIAFKGTLTQILDPDS